MKKIIVIIGALIAILAIAFVGLRIYTKQFSPQDIASFDAADISLSVQYSRPLKKDRDIFGGLVPYGEVWRTGANEATTFTTSQPLLIKGEKLPAGTYSLFTVPGENSWQIIFNKETGQWGVSPFSGGANRDDDSDVIVVEVNAVNTPDVFEQFTITFEKMGEEIEMILMWDQTLVVVPMTVAD